MMYMASTGIPDSISSEPAGQREASREAESSSLLLNEGGKCKAHNMHDGENDADKNNDLHAELVWRSGMALLR